MKLIQTGCIALVFCNLAGCAKWKDSTAMAYSSDVDGKVFIWRSNYSAGIGTKNGLCAQGALTAVANNMDASAKAGAGLAGVIVPGLGSGNKEDLAKAALSLGQSVTLTNATNNQTAFANISLFYLCQISLNRNLDAKTIAQMWETTNKTIADIGETPVVPGSISALSGAQQPPNKQGTEGKPETLD